MGFKKRKSDNPLLDKLTEKLNERVYPQFRKLAFKLDPELAHDMTIKSMSHLGGWVNNVPTDPRLKFSAMGLNFKGPLGLAAGLDKNAEAIHFLTYLPFSFIEVGTVTPKAQSGNPRPRLFRYIEEESLRNCMGFNNKGAEAVLKNIQNAERREKILGVNLGKNKVTPNESAHLDYASLYETFAPHADYLVINVSSPNTPGLRDLLKDQGLREIFSSVSDLRKKYKRPLLVKISPDMGQDELKSVVDLSKEYDLSGIIATNTTIMPERGQGGISGKLLYQKAKQTREYLLESLRETPQIELIGVGGFSSYEDCVEFWQKGGRLIQLYTAFVFQGPRILFDIEKKITDQMEKENLRTFEEFLTYVRQS